MAEAKAQMNVSIASSFEAVADLAEQISVFCETEGHGDEDLRDTVRLCIAEALNNIFEHAYECAEGRPISANVHLSDDRYRFILIDEGKAMPNGRPPEGDASFDPNDIENLPEGGFGWMLIRSQMDRIEYERENGCNVLLMEKSVDAHALG